MFQVEISTLVSDLSQYDLFVVQKLSLGKEQAVNKQAVNSNTCLYKPVDLPADFELPNKFGKKIDQTLKECKKPGSVPPDVMKRVVRQVADHIEVENLSHPKRPLSGLPGLTA